MPKIVLTKSADGSLAATFPVVGAFPLESAAERDVPHGVAYLIVDDDQQTAALDFSKPTGIGLGYHRWVIKQTEAEIERIHAREQPVAPASRDNESYIPDEELLAGVDQELSGLAETTGETELEQMRAIAFAMAKEQSRAAVDEENASIDASNADQAAAYEVKLATWLSRKELDLAACDAQIAQMKAEVFLLEGIAL